LDGLEKVLSNLPSLGAYGGFAVLLAMAVRMAWKSDARYNAEVDEHQQTQKALDDERDLRRRLEDDLGEVRREVQQLRAEVRGLRAQVAANGGAT
jgi:hypothetical protein